MRFNDAKWHFYQLNERKKLGIFVQRFLLNLTNEKKKTDIKHLMSKRTKYEKKEQIAFSI